MCETDFVENSKALLFFFYGLVFFSVGIGIFLLPHRERPSGRNFRLLGAFGVLQGVSEWLSLTGIADPDLKNLSIASTGLSFLCLFEFGRRLTVEVGSGIHSRTASAVARPHVAYLLPALGGLLWAFNKPGLAESEAFVRFTLGFPGAILSGAGFLYYSQTSQMAIRYRAARRGLRMAGFAFFVYAISAGLFVWPSDDPLPLSQASTFSEIVRTVEFLRALIGGYLLLGLTQLIQAFNLVADNRLLEARGEAHSLRQRSELILELVDDGVCGIDQDGNIAFANAAAKRMLGYDDDGLLGLPFRALRGFTSGEDKTCGAPPSFPHAEHYRSDREFLCRKDGRCFPVEYTSVPKFEGGQLAGAVLAFRDISERRRREVAERCEQEERFGALFDQAAVGMAVLDTEGQCLQVNARLSKMLGFSLEEMTQTNFSEFMHPDERAQCGIIKARLASDNYVSVPVEGRCIRHDNSILWVQFSFAMVRNCDDQPMYCFLTVEDITERKQAERIRKHYQEKLERQVKERTRALALSNQELESANRELEAFSYSVSHDLRSPLRSINGFSHGLAEEYGPVLDETGLSYIERIRSATVRMGDLIDSLLNLARVFQSKLTVTTVDLSNVAGEVADQLKQNYPERQMTVHIEPGIVAKGDPTLLRLLLQNLLDNAWKFTEGRDQSSITFGREVCDGTETYFIGDNGVGFESEYAHKLFQPFERLHGDSEYEGIGIGLATVRRIVQRHGGIAWARGVPGKGATFYFTLGSQVARETSEDAMIVCV